MEIIKENHTVALLKDIPSKKLQRGDVGTVVVGLSETKPDISPRNLIECKAKGKLRSETYQPYVERAF